jgi:hypothetical protein
MIKRYLLAAGIGAMGVGMVLVYTAVIGSRLLMPGTVLIAVGIVLCAAALVVPDADVSRSEASPPSATHE